MLVWVSSIKTHVGNSVVGDLGARYREKLMAILHREELFIYNEQGKQAGKQYLDLFSISPRSVAWWKLW